MDAPYAIVFQMAKWFGIDRAAMFTKFGKRLHEFQ